MGFLLDQNIDRRYEHLEKSESLRNCAKIVMSVDMVFYSLTSKSMLMAIAHEDK